MMRQVSEIQVVFYWFQQSVSYEQRCKVLFKSGVAFMRIRYFIYGFLETLYCHCPACLFIYWRKKTYFFVGDFLKGISVTCDVHAHIGLGFSFHMQVVLTQELDTMFIYLICTFHFLFFLSYLTFPESCFKRTIERICFSSLQI